MAGSRGRRPALVLLAVVTSLGVVIGGRACGRSVPRGTDAQGHPWMGATNPKVTVHEYTDYACPHCPGAAERMATMVRRHSGELRLVRHQYPRMRCLRMAPYRHCEYARLALCAGEQGRFWEMDAWLFEHVQKSLQIDPAKAAADVGLDAKRLTTCAESVTTFERADREVQEAKDAEVAGTPSYVIDGRVHGLPEALDEIEKRL